MTLVPNSWSLRKAAEVFSVSKSTIQKHDEKKLNDDEKGIAEYPHFLKQQRLTQEFHQDSFLEKRIMLAFEDKTMLKRDCFFGTLKNFMLRTNVPIQKINFAF